ncbi:universal stress protein [Terrabacter sp. NPDC080008]|uniref:universal stress protein n=1 Tax=Terrabacter sp. NPDC080008 TaxID=3155176 RepID=UPI00344FCF2F
MSDQQAGPVVVGVDGSASSKEALRWAARMAAVEGVPIRAVTAWDYPQAYNSPVDVNWRPDVDAETVLRETLDEVFGDDRPAGLEAQVAHGPARTVLLEASKGATLLVVGSRGHGGFAGLLLGSVSSACAEHGHCPVLVVHEQREHH